MADTSIEWTRNPDGSPGKTWNPTTGCDRVSPGCDHCYALTLAKRLKGMGSAKYQTDGDPRTSGPGFGVAVHPDSLRTPMSWRKPQRVFVNSMSDLFHPRIPDNFIGSVFDTMALTPQHTYMILTKRPKRMRSLLNRWQEQAAGRSHAGASFRRFDMMWSEPRAWPLANVWLGTSVENERYRVERIFELLDTPAAVRFLSCEPLLGPLRLTVDLMVGMACDPPAGIGWVIAGGESGPGARPADPDWVRGIRDACVATGVPFFFKQWGGRTPKAGGRLLDGRTWDEFPAVSEAVSRG